LLSPDLIKVVYSFTPFFSSNYFALMYAFLHQLRISPRGTKVLCRRSKGYKSSLQTIDGVQKFSTDDPMGTKVLYRRSMIDVTTVPHPCADHPLC
jgi:hypothetical protein